MDSKRFDNISRAMASGASRRSLIKSLFGIGGAAAVTVVAADGGDTRRRGGITTPTTPPPTTTTSPPEPTCDTGYACGIDCCADEHQCCGNECCPDGTVCLTSWYGGEIDGIEEETCCAVANLCDADTNGKCCEDTEECCSLDGCCDGDCYTPLELVGLQDGEPSCCEAPDFVCSIPDRPEAGELCCDAGLECCTSGDFPVCIDPQTQCCFDDDCPDSPSTCQDGVCDSDNFCTLSENNCPATTPFCCGGDNLCCADEASCCSSGPGPVCIDTSTQCCVLDDCLSFDSSWHPTCIDCDASNQCVPVNEDVLCGSTCAVCDGTGQCDEEDDALCAECQECDGDACIPTNEGGTCADGGICCSGDCLPGGECCNVEYCSPEDIPCEELTCDESGTCVSSGCPAGRRCCEDFEGGGDICIFDIEGACCNTGECATCQRCDGATCIFDCREGEICCIGGQVCSSTTGQCIDCVGGGQSCNNTTGPGCCTGSCCGGTCCEDFCLQGACETCLPAGTFGCGGTDDCCEGRCVGSPRSCICYEPDHAPPGDAGCTSHNDCCGDAVCTFGGLSGPNFCRASCVGEGGDCSMVHDLYCCLGLACFFEPGSEVGDLGTCGPFG